MSLERVEEAVLAEARREAEGLLAAARERLAGRLDSARREIEARFEARRRRELARLEGESLSEAAAARAAARLEVLAAKNRLIEGVFERALRQLAALPRGEFQELAARWLGQVPPELPGEVLAGDGVRGFLDAAFMERVNAGRAGRLELSSAPGPKLGGLLVRAERFDFDFTWAGRLADRRAALTAAVAAELFGGKAQP